MPGCNLKRFVSWHTRPSSNGSIIVFVKQVTLLLLITFSLLTACGGGETAEPAAEVLEPMEQATVAPATAPAVPQPTDTSAPPDVPTEASTVAPVEEETMALLATEPASPPVPTKVVEPTAAVEEPAPIQVISGQTSEGAYFYGDPAAPLVLIDYSDFL